MNYIEINTVETGLHILNLPKCVKKTITGGLWSNGDIQIACYTSENERTGFLITYNQHTQQMKYERLKISYIDSDSIKKYGRNVVREILPIQ